MANVATPSKDSPCQNFFDQSIAGTPEPQASSTVDRRNRNVFPPPDKRSAPTQVKQELSNSPAFLLNAISGMRQLTDQLGLLEDSSASAKMPPPHFVPSKRSSVGPGIMEYENRRESVATESEANSSLGILKLDNMQGFSETEDMGDVSQVLAHFRYDAQVPDPDVSYQSLLGKENVERTSVVDSNGGTSNADAYLKSLRNSSSLKHSGKRPILEDVSDNVLNCKGESRLSSASSVLSVTSSHDTKSDLRLRMQRALAKRTIDRSAQSTFRMSQLSDLLDDSVLSLNSNVSEMLSPEQPEEYSPYNSPSANPSIQTSVNSTNKEGSFGAENFPFSMNGSPFGRDSLSSESFQPAEVALARLEQDENSWRQRFDVLPMDPNSHPDANTSSNAVQHLTQNLELSTLSGITGGEVTVSSSVLEETEKRRLSMGEYFGLRTEKLGGVSSEQSDEDRPNFGNVIKSPTRNRPHPPLVDISTSQDVPLDEVPTRDAGPSVVLNSSFGDTLEFSTLNDSLDASQRSDINNVPESLTQSADLMPPPALVPPKASLKPSVSAADNHKSYVVTPRDSVASRLSVSLCLPNNSNAGPTTDMDLSSLSLDSGERRSSGVASISQIANLLSEMPGSLSSRNLVDNLMKGFASRKVNSDVRSVSRNESSAESRSCGVSDVSLKSTSNPPKMRADQVMPQSSQRYPTTKERVTEWVSMLNIHHQDSVVDNSLEARSITPSETYQKVHRKERKEAMPPPSSHPYRQQRRSVDVGSSRPHRSVMTGNAGTVRSKSVSAPLRRDQARAFTSVAYDGDESDTSFMPPPGKSQVPVSATQRVHSTPKPHSRKTLSNDSQREVKDRRSVNSNQSEGDGKHSSDTDGNGDRRSVASGRKGSLNSATGSPHNSESRAPSACESAKNSSRHTEASSVISGTPLQVDSTHTQISWAAVSPGSSVTEAFALRNKASVRVRLLVSSSEATFKLIGERGEVVSELSLSLHSEETRRIHVMFTPSSIGPVVGKLVIRRITNEISSTSSGERRLIPLYGYCGTAGVIVEGASRDQWSQQFVNVCAIDADERCEISVADSATDVPLLGASFSVRNTGSVPAFASLQIAAHEVPFSDCGVSITPSHLTLAPGQVDRVTIRFEPNHDVLQWLLAHAGDVQLLANVWISWAELSTWQRIRRLFLKYYRDGVAGPLASWGTVYTGELGDACELRDRQTAETILVQGVRRIKLAVLGERDQLKMFDLDATLVFQQLDANDTIMLNSPPVDLDADISNDVTFCDNSPLLAGNLGALRKNFSSTDSPSGRPENKSRLSVMKNTKSNQQGLPSRASLASSNLSVCSNASTSSQQKYPVKKQETLSIPNALPRPSNSYIVEFPPTVLGHKSIARVSIENTSREKCHVSVRGATNPFTVVTPEFDLQGRWYLTLRLFFKPQTPGPAQCELQIFFDDKLTLNYCLKGDGVNA